MGHPRHPLVLLRLFLVIELAQEFTVQKLSVPFFLLSWVVLLLLHEGGHALMAWILGWRVERICIGAGRVRHQRRLRGAGWNSAPFP